MPNTVLTKSAFCQATQTQGLQLPMQVDLTVLNSIAEDILQTKVLHVSSNSSSNSSKPRGVFNT